MFGYLIEIIAGSQDGRCLAKFPVPMRVNPTITFNNLYCDSENSGNIETSTELSKYPF